MFYNFNQLWNRASGPRQRNGSMVAVGQVMGTARGVGSSYMAKASAERAAELASYLHAELEREAQIPQWMERAITVAKHHLEGVSGALLGSVSVGRAENGAALVNRSGCTGCEACEESCRFEGRAVCTPGYARPGDHLCSTPGTTLGVCPPRWQNPKPRRRVLRRRARLARMAGSASVGEKACCSSCAHGGPCEGGCGDKCTKGCPDHIRYRKRNHAPGDPDRHGDGVGSFYTKQNLWQLDQDAARVSASLTGQDRLPDWVEQKIHETAAILGELAARVGYLRHIGMPLMAHAGEPDAAA